MSVYLRYSKRTRLSLTPGAQPTSAATSFSGTAVPALTLGRNTAPPFSGEVVTIIGQIFAEAEGPVRVRTPVTKRRTKRSSKKGAEPKTKFDIIPAFTLQPQPQEPALEMRSVNTSLKDKARKEISEFEREYPW